DVAPVGPKDLPFRVIARRTHFIATGTKFVLTSFPEDSSAVLKVLEGTVTVKGAKGTQVVSANQTVFVDSAGFPPPPHGAAPTEAEASRAFAWIDGRVVSNRHLRDATATLMRWFNMDIKIPDAALNERDAAFNVPLDSSNTTLAAIKQIEQSAKVKFGFDGDT